MHHQSIPSPKRQHSYYNRMLIGFASICTCMLLIFSAVLGISFYNTIYKITRDYHNKIFDNTITLIEQTFERVAESVTQLALNRNVNLYLTKNDSFDYDNLSLLLSSLSDMTLANDFTNSIYLVAPNRDRVVTSYGIYDYKSFIDFSWLDETNQGEQNLKWIPTRGIYKDKMTLVQENVVTLVCRLPLFGKGSTGYVIYNIKESYLKSLLAQFEPPASSITFLMSENVIVSTANHDLSPDFVASVRERMMVNQLSHGETIQTLHHYDHMILFHRSPLTGWIFVTYVPMQLLMKNMLAIVLVLGGCALGLLLMSFFAIRIFSRNLYRPVKALLHYSGSDHLSQPAVAIYNEFEQIQRNLTAIWHDNQHLSDTLSSLKPTLQERFFVNLFKGSDIRSHETNQYLQYFDIDTGHSDHFCVYSISINKESTKQYTPQQRAYLHFQIAQVAQSMAQAHGLFCVATELASGAIVVTVGTKDCDNIPLLLFTLCSQLSSYIQKELGLHAAISIGNPVLTLESISESFQQSQEALTYTYLYEPDPVILFSTIPSATGIYLNPLTYERPLVNAVKASEEKEVERILGHLKEVVSTQAFPLSYGRHLFWGMINITLLASEELGNSTDVEEKCTEGIKLITHSESLEEIFQLSLHFCLYVARHFKMTRLDKANRIAADVLMYIQNNYHQDICLNDLSNALLYTPTHINKVLKSATQKTFYDLLTQVRIQKAKDLLRNSNLPIMEVAQQVGYINVQSFIRMYKRETGNTPGRFREEN